MSVDIEAGPRLAGPPGQQFALLDRRTERAAIDRILDAVRSGFSGALVLRGEPGVGKTALLRYAVAAAADLRVSSITGVESEISMDYGGLHQLLRPFLPLLDALPPPQREALRVAFGQQAGPPPERFHRNTRKDAGGCAEQRPNTRPQPRSIELPIKIIRVTTHEPAAPAPIQYPLPGPLRASIVRPISRPLLTPG